MKKILALLIGCGTVLSAISQTITVKVNGTRNQQVIVDGRTYTIDNYTNNRTITITDLGAGQHTLQVVRSNRNAGATTTFTTRNGYDAMITITGSGAVQVKEKRGTDLSTTVRTPMSDDAFATLLRQTRNHIRNSSRITAITSALSNTGNYFTTAQVKMLLESFSGEDKRLELARMAYDRVTDRMNYATLGSLFTTQQYRDDLTAYIRSRGGNDLVYSYSESFRTPLADATFSGLLEDVQAQWQEGARLSTIIDIFNDNRNYFTTAQAMQLIQQVYDQGSRLHLAKAAYSRVVDPENFSQIYSLFTDQARINSLSAYIGANANNTTMNNIHNAGKSPMTEASFTSLYNNARNHFRVSSIQRAVSDAFANTANYFTSYQARQLILLVRDEATRLQLARAAYRSITDASNFMAQMNDLFTLQSSRDELQAYINNYKE